ncbi:ribosomal small subunit pseudouridine synthase A [Sulfurimonas denitrificans DSM 1251]|jgi:16S rRNA pseudouridine516 synthase|uniref:Pseudouridine synthase n=1 Tax=Sulfurimonas denitrificans (strain ATCC 33889 / DSM 1251) TaxID=326298 RepID=Q30NZ7_SULDN|nr:pseudouridine synthase [Sulfurimonas denitrificans]ABB45284.1 ribosomal small subunit pseudouridine synthase A [Sulfurimonas denitrificans DSM 1251]MDD3442083.1 pseudouridine synthase [Sulfurimonas denitrificans]
MQNSLKRVDAHLSSLGYCTRSEAKRFLTTNNVSVYNERIFDVTKKVHHSEIRVNGELLDAERLVILMNKPHGVVCSHSDSGVLIYSLLPPRWQRRNPKVSTIGRLDIDTTGAILLSDDGALNHKLTSPKSEVTKIYEVTLAQALRGDEAEIFASGELLLNGEKKPLLPAKMEVIGPIHVRVEICEGRYHQVKRMFASVGNRVTALHRASFGDFSVEDLKPSEFREISL